MTVSATQNPTDLSPDQFEVFDENQRRGASVRIGTGIFMWLFTLAAFLSDSIQVNRLIGVSLTIVFLVGLIPSVRWFLKNNIGRQHFEYVCPVVYMVEIFGYTAVIYFLGGINALFLSPIYAVLVASASGLGPPNSPYKYAGLCATAVGLMAAMEFFGILAPQNSFWSQRPAGFDQIIILAVVFCLIYSAAFVSSHIGAILKRNKTKLKEQGSELIRTRRDLKETVEQCEINKVALQLAARQAQESEKMKSEFLANMSHELRTPLNHIIGFTEIMIDKKFGELNDIQQEYLSDVLESGNNLLALISDILDLSMAEAGKLKLDLSNVDLRMLMDTSLKMFREDAKQHNIRLSLQMDPTIGQLKADERKLQQVMNNLLSNAMKFTPDGGAVIVSAQIVERFVRPGRRREDADNYQVILDPQQIRGASVSNLTKCIEISVSDTGIGLRVDDKMRIFNRFEQADGSIRKNYNGTGLGLSLCKNIVEFHGGRIWADSDGAGKGSTFYFVLPTWRNSKVKVNASFENSISR